MTINPHVIRTQFQTYVLSTPVVPPRQRLHSHKSQPLHDMAYDMVITSDGFMQSIRGVYDSREKADARVDSLEDDSCEIVEFDALNQDCDIKY